MRAFMDDDFLLSTESAKRLFHEYAKDAPIIDFHSHLPPQQVADDARFENITKIWLGGDHYKWRAMRTNGVPEELVTGKGSDYEKFLAWAKTMPRTIGNPLYHWTHLELRRYFGVQEILDEKSAPVIWERCNSVISTKEFSVRNLLKRMKVRALCTTDDPIDELSAHKAYAAEGKNEMIMVPCFRPDKAVAIDDASAWNAYVAKLEAASGMKIVTYRDLIEALDKRHAAFHDLGCRLSDHALEKPFAVAAAESDLEASFLKLRKGQALAGDEKEALKTAILAEVGRMDANRDWTMQLHIGAIRNLNSRMFAKLGPDTGYDAAADEPIAKPLAKFLDLLDKEGKLPKTILYTLNPCWNEVLATIMGCFQDGSVPGKIQFGSAWWFNDQIDGMQRQLAALSSLGLLSRFVGMLTDSRSFLSFPRHEYFRRILCEMVGGWAERGEVPGDFDLLGETVREVSFGNAYRTFKIPGAKGW